MNNTIIVVDIGNSTICVGLFVDGKLKHRLDTISSLDDILLFKQKFSHFLASNHIDNKDIVGGLISSVVPSFTNTIKNDILEVCSVTLDVMSLKHFSFIEMDIDNPRELGSDLASDLVACKKHYGYPSLIIDMGTITKFLLLDKKGVFTGTSFFPGVNGCINIMRSSTAQLPTISLDNKPKDLLGKNTIDAMKSGIYYPTLFFINGMKDEMRKKYPNIKLILTGGNGNTFKDDLKDFIYDKDLILKGIYEIYINN